MTTEGTTHDHQGITDVLVGDPEQVARNQAAIALLRSWRHVSEEEAAEQRETGEYLRRASDKERARVGARLLFP